MIRRVLLILVAAAVVRPVGAVAIQPAPDLIVESPPELGSVAAEVERIGGGDFTGPLAITGLMGFSAPIRVVVASEGSDLATRTPGWVSGFATGASRTIVLFPGRVATYPDDNLATLVHHEVTHVLVAEAARGRPVPRWFNEGIATVAAREWGIEDRARYAVAVVGRSMRSTADLDEGFAAGGRRAARSYALSSAFVRWIRVEYGQQVTASILERLGRDMSFREAFVRSTGDTIEWAEHRFFVREAVWHTWVPFLTSSGVLWAAITALALIAIQRRRQRSAAMREFWEHEERLSAVEPETSTRRPARFGRSPSLDDVDDDVVN
ncbi:MAG: hypothetical protein V2I67_03330 [Thermoanaerobaculales bacterium]|jgi:hypothetical protein|nr:hypothetical protein [Thermoanaerobaculales bacterium]